MCAKMFTLRISVTRITAVMKKAKTEKRLSIVVPRSLLRLLDESAKLQDRTRSAEVRRRLEMSLKADQAAAPSSR